jgi:hypothetical protein
MENAANGQPLSEAANQSSAAAITAEQQKAIRNEKIKDTLVSTAKVAGQAALTIVSAAVFGYVLGATLRSATNAGEKRALEDATMAEPVEVIEDAHVMITH